MIFCYVIIVSAAPLGVLEGCFSYNDIAHKSRFNYRQVSNIRRTLVGNQIVDGSDVVGASPVGAAPTTPSFST